MLPIYICEDEKAQLVLLKKNVHDYLSIKHIDNTHKIFTFSDPNKFLEFYQNNPQICIYIIDYNLGEKMNGFELAKKIRNMDPIGYMIFVTTHEEVLPLALNMQINTLDFIIKDSIDFKQQLYSVLDSAFKMYESFTKSSNTPHDFYFVNFGNQSTPVAHNDIKYIEVSPKPHRLTLKTSTMCIEFYEKLDNVYSALNSNAFIRCSRSAIVNVNYIDYINKTEKKIYLCDGKEFTYSSRMTSEITAKYGGKYIK